MKYKILKAQGRITKSFFIYDEETDRLQEENGLEITDKNIIIALLNDKRGQGYDIISIQLENGIVVTIEEPIKFDKQGQTIDATVKKFVYIDGLYVNTDYRGGYSIMLKNVISTESVKEETILSTNKIYSLADIKAVLTPILEDDELNQVLADLRAFNIPMVDNVVEAVKEAITEEFPVTEKSMDMLLEEYYVEEPPVVNYAEQHNIFIQRHEQLVRDEQLRLREDELRARIRMNMNLTARQEPDPTIPPLF